MKSMFLFLLVLPLTAANISKVNFPSLKGETLDGKQIELPKDCVGKKAFIGLAYSEKAQEALLSWYEPAFEKFVQKVGMFDSQYDVKLYFVPMFIGLKQTLYESTLKKLRSENRKDLYPYILFYKGELQPYDSELSLKDKSMPYFFLLDEKGVVIYSTQGEFTEKKMEAIEAALDK